MAPRPQAPHALSYVLLGLCGGALYVMFDLVSETRLAHGTLTGALAGLHGLVDHLIPLVAGASLGLCLYQLRLKARLAAAEEAASRAEALRMRLQKVERDQAVWILAARVLHELNNPLHALGLLLDEANLEGDEAHRKELLERARSQTRRALAHLATLRSMQSGVEPELRRVSLERMVGALAEELAQLARSEGILVSVECSEPVEASADPTYLRTILENLLDNSLHALKGAQGGRVTIRLAHERGCAVVRVGDDGPPLTPEVRAALFDPLRSTKSSGLGLGLPIARALARAMHGELSLEEATGKAFRLELPLGART